MRKWTPNRKETFIGFVFVYPAEGSTSKKLQSQMETDGKKERERRMR